ncbi:hypothetical protein HY797_00435 [Candidatus Falkowbacteria bacterium]|nr:hypothetical protein [Candidatus Falkowbacteria bacterium]
MALDKNFEEELLHKIEAEKIQPKPRWRFLLKDYVIWSMGILALFLGAISMSLIFYMSRYNDLEVYARSGGRFWEKLLLLIPTFWLICLAVFILAVVYNIKHTKKGYRYPLFLIVLGIISASVILGGIFYAVGFGEKIDDSFSRHAPFYDRLINPRIDFWSQPENGRLMGLIISRADNDVYILANREMEEWKVLTKDAKQAPGAELKVGRPARFMGKVQAEREFIAAEILPMMPGKGFFEKGGFMKKKFPGPMPEDINRLSDCQKYNKTPDKLSELLEKYPELKSNFTDDLLKNKDKIKEIIKNDPDFIKNLELLKIDQAAIERLRE